MSGSHIDMKAPSDHHRRVNVPHHLRLCHGREAAHAELAQVLAGLGYSRPQVVAGKTSAHLLGDHLLADGGRVELVTDNSISEVERLYAALAECRCDCVVGVGGGKVLDVAKCASARRELPFISVPTQISNDGICSPVAVIKNASGKTDSLGARIPVAIIIDLDVVAESPLSSLQAGVGDLVSNIFAVADWRLAADKVGEELDDYAAMVALTSANSLYESAWDGAIDLRNERTLSLLVNGLVLSGIAMELCGSSRPCSGAEHKISHSLDAYMDSPASHGVQVALGSMVSAYLHGADWERLRAFFRRVGVPDDPALIGLSDESMAEAIFRAPGTRVDRYTILEDAGLTRDDARALVGRVWER